MTDIRDIGWMLLILVVLTVIIILLLNAEANACADLGGHLVSLYKSSICVDSDGRILQ